MARRGVKILLAAVLALALVLAAYVIYVFAAWYRVEDWQELEITAAEGEGEPLSPGETYRIASYNIGFGAYSDDYSFFMDGGTESRARSEEAVYENVGGAMAAVQALEPDFLLLQEVDVDGTRSYHVDELTLAADAMGDGYWSTFAQNYDSPYLFWPPLEPHGANRSGQATFSRFPIASAVRRQLPIEEGVMKLGGSGQVLLCPAPPGVGWPGAGPLQLPSLRLYLRRDHRRGAAGDALRGHAVGV